MTACATSRSSGVRHHLGLRRLPACPPRAAVFDTTPTSFAVREPMPGVDLDAARPRPGLGVALWLHADDAQALHDSLAAADVPIPGAPFDGPFGRTFTFTDPDGYAVTIHDQAWHRGDAMRQHEVTVDVLGPWSLATSRAFWECFGPAAMPAQNSKQQLHTFFCVEADWRRAEATVAQQDGTAHIRVAGDGGLEAAAAQVCRFLSLDVDARGWPDIAVRDPVIAKAQAQLPGLRPGGFHSPYEAAPWSVLSQRIRIIQAARRDDLLRRHGDRGAFPAPQALCTLELDLPGRKSEYLHAVADAALDGRLDAAALRSVDSDEAIRAMQEVKGLGPFAAELVVVRGANAPDVLPRHERRLDDEIAEQYGPGATSLRSPRPGGPSARGQPSTSESSGNNAPERSRATPTRPPDGTLLCPARTV